ncbi:MAG: hypothetical protein K0S74_47 [Chlamydiales bacterium]|jgi:predicted RNA-binding protein with PIN domain|nr:hypothetical protein [Chlamydiales bacterium]
MKYYVDGYNLLFRLNPTFRTYKKIRDLHTVRNKLIHELSDKVTLLELNLTLVFDGADEFDNFSRSHFQGLDLIFTPLGTSADDYFITLLQKVTHPQHYTMITNDRELLNKSHSLGACVLRVDDFYDWLTQVYRRAARKRKALDFQERAPSVVAYSDYDYYHEIFEERLEIGEKQEYNFKPDQIQVAQLGRKSKISAKTKASTLEEAKRLGPEEQRWLLLFEQNNLDDL